MINYRSEGSIFDCGAEALVNPVNCVGTMGAGLAKAFRDRFPGMFQVYLEAARRGAIVLGKVSVWENPEGNPKYVINLPTKQHWRNPSHVVWVENGVKDLARTIEKLGLQSVAIPALGCGHGGLQFHDIQPVLERYLKKSDVEVIAFLPEADQASQASIESARGSISPHFT